MWRIIPGTTTVAAAPVNACTALKDQNNSMLVQNASANELMPNSAKPTFASNRLPSSSAIGPKNNIPKA